MIKIIDAVTTTSEKDTSWDCRLSITQESDTWILKANAPVMDRKELQAHFDALEAELWQVAQLQGYQDDIFERTNTKYLLRAIVEVLVGEINLLRAKAGLPERSKQQVLSAIRKALKEA